MARGVEVDVRPAADVRSIGQYDAVIVAGGLYANRWHRHARRFMRQHAKALRQRPVWLVSSGPLDDSARLGTLEPVPQVARAMRAVGARAHQTFGGYFAPDAKGFAASVMPKNLRGDWRDPAQVAEVADSVAAALAAAPAPEDRTKVPTVPGGRQQG